MENVDLRQEFWRHKKVFITGHTGFKGSWLSLWLQKLGADCVGFSLDAPSEPHLFHLASIDKNMVSLTGDITDYAALQQALLKHQPDMVFHLAAQPLVPLAKKDPVNTYLVNVMGTVNLLEVLRSLPKTRVAIMVTSDKCYNNKESYWAYREGDPLGGKEPYSSSKACAELVTEAYRETYFSHKTASRQIAIASVRAGNVIGGGDWGKDRLLPDIMKACATHKTIKLRNPGSIRPWQFVLEPLAGYLLLAERCWHDKQAYAQAWNFGPNLEEIYPVSWIVDKVLDLWSGAKVSRSQIRDLLESQFLRVDSTKARMHMGWKPALNIEAALQWTVNWYKAYYEGQNPRELCLNQIHQYEQEKELRLCKTAAFAKPH